MNDRQHAIFKCVFLLLAYYVIVTAIIVQLAFYQAKINENFIVFIDAFMFVFLSFGAILIERIATHDLSIQNYCKRDRKIHIP